MYLLKAMMSLLRSKKPTFPSAPNCLQKVSLIQGTFTRPGNEATKLYDPGKPAPYIPYFGD